MGVVTNSIGTSARNFSTVQAWEDALPANLVTDGNSYVGECFNDSEFTTTGVLVTFAGSTTDSTHTITLTTGTGQSFRDNANVQTNALRYNASNGVGLRGNTSGYAHVVVVSEDNVHLSKLQIKNSTTGAPGDAAYRQTATALSGSDVDGCILHGTRHGATSGTACVEFLSGTLRNSLIIGGDTGRAVTVGYAGATAPSIINCTLVLPSDGTSAIEAVEGKSGTATVTNCAIFGYPTLVNSTARFTGSNNASDLAIGFGTSNQASKTYANQFQNTALATADFRLKTGADCIDTGVTDSTNAPTDIAGTSRPSGSAYDIGAWEFVQAGGGGGVVSTIAALPLLGVC